MASDASRNRKIVWSLVVVLGVLHYDFWFWEDRSLMFGFMPVGLFYQALISVATGIVWALVVRHAWPSGVEQWASEAPGDPERDRA